MFDNVFRETICRETTERSEHYLGGHQDWEGVSECDFVTLSILVQIGRSSFGRCKKYSKTNIIQ
jgi:hypothetical protein